MNWQTLLVAAIVFGVAATIIIVKIRSRKKGKSSCGCGCQGCALSGQCHK